MSADLRFAAATGARIAPAAPGFVAATLRRIGAAELSWGAAIVVLVVMLGAVSRLRWFGLFTLHDNFQRSMLLIEVGMTCAVMLALVAADEAVARGAPRWPAYFGSVFAACLAATLLLWCALLLLGWETLFTPADSPQHPLRPLSAFLTAWLYGTLACVAYVNRRIAIEAAARMHEAELARAASRRRTLESRLQAMQARVEPQFLFNTLAQVRELFERDAELGGRMLEDLIAYLRAALPHLRESSSTLGQELRLVQAYLDILRIRLGDKLAFAIEPAEGAAGARMPPMLLLPIVDHLLAPGVAASPARREIRIAARVADGRLRVSVAGIASALAPGVAAPALDGIEQRLRALYGGAARLERALSDGRGSLVLLDMPLAMSH
jgi:hypothetical protein